MIATRDQVLSLLRQRGEFVSGEEISSRIGVTRAAVSVAVKALREDGYEIQSVTNKGYRLVAGPDRLSMGELLPYLPAEQAGRVTVLDRVDSTNLYLKRLCAAGEARPGDCAIANCQTSGRGRMGRSFVSAENVGIYLSYVFDPKDCGAAELSEVTAWIAVAMRAAIEESCGIDCGIKWVNDLVMHRKKLCGILTEMSLEGESGRIQSVIMGIGVNVNNDAADFAPALSDIATSLKIESGAVQNRARLAAAMVRHLDQLQADFPHHRAAYLDAYRQHCAMLGQPVLLARGDTVRRGTALDIDDHFGLIVRWDTGETETVTGGEVSVKGFYGV